MAKLHLYGSVGESFWGEDSFTAKDVREQLAKIKGPVEVHLNSGGGSATDGQAIYAILKAHPHRVTIIVEGCAASAASLIAMAGAEIVLTDGAWLLLHDPASPWTDGRGTPDDHAKAAQMLELIAVAYAEIYARRSGNSVEDVRALMRAETLLVGDAAVQMGFADRVDREAAARAVAAFDYRVYATAPKAARQASERLGAFQGKGAVLAMIAGIAGTAMETKMNVRVSPPQGGDTGQEPKTKITMTAHQVSRLHGAASVAGMTAADVNKIIEEGKTFEQALMAVNDHWASLGDQGLMVGAPTARIGHDASDPKAIAARMGDAIAAKIGARMGVKHEPTSGREFAEFSIADMNATLLRAHGHRVTSPSQAMMSSLSTGDFPLAIGAGLTSIVRNMAEQAPVAIERCARLIEADDYRTGNAISISGASVPEAVGEAGEIKTGFVNDEGEVKASPTDYGQFLRITKQALVNDSTATGILSEMARQQGKGARELKRRVLLAPLLANAGLGQTLRDGQTLFHSTHGNLAGTGAVLSVTTLSAARTAMLRQKDSNGIILAPEPVYIVVPPELQTAAEQVVAQITANTTATVNPFAGRLEVVAEPGLTNLTAWYVVADPGMTDGLVMAYLSGESGPRIEAKDGWETLGMEFRLVWSIGSAFHGWQGWYRNPGA